MLGVREVKRSAGALVLATAAALAIGMLAAPAALAAADMSISKTATPDPVQLGQDVTYTITVTNNGPDTATSVVALDNLPDEVTFQSATASTGVTCTFDGTFARCPFGAVMPGSVTMTVVATVNQQPADGTMTNLCTVTSSADSFPDNDHCTLETQVGSTVLEITKTDNPDPVQRGTTLTYTIVVRNAGTVTARNVVVADSLPLGVLFSTAPGCTVSGRQVNCVIGDMPAGSAATVQVFVVPTISGAILNTAGAMGSNTNSPQDVEFTSAFCFSEAPLSDLDQMDEIVRKLKREKGLSEKEVKLRTSSVERTKLRMVREHFPGAFGVRFIDLFVFLELLDDDMARARRLVDNPFHKLGRDFTSARENIGELRTLLTGSSAPAGVVRDLDEMDKILQKLKREKGLSEKEVKLRTSSVERTKLGMLRRHFPDICGVRFIDLFVFLELLDDDMARARRLVDNPFHKLGRDFTSARENIGELRTLLEAGK